MTVSWAEVCRAHDRATQLGASPWKGRVWEIVSRPAGGRQLCRTPGVDVGALSRGWGHVGDSLGAKMPSGDAGGRQHRGSESSSSVQQGLKKAGKKTFSCTPSLVNGPLPSLARFIGQLRVIFSG